MYTKIGIQRVLGLSALLAGMLAQGVAQPFPEKLMPPLEALPSADSLSTAGLQQWGIRLAGRTYELMDYENQALSRHQYRIDSLSAAVEIAREDEEVDKKTIRSMNKAVKDEEAASRLATGRISRLSEFLQQCSAYNTAEADSQRVALPGLWSRLNQLEEEARRRAGLAPDPVGRPESADASMTALATEYAAYAPENDVMLHPPAPACRWSLNEKDAFSGEIRRETEKEPLFRFTNPKLQAFFGKKPQTVCEASLAQNGETLRLNLAFTIHDPNARNTFGSLGANSAALLKLLDGGTLTLLNVRSDEGAPLPDNAGYVYRGQYLLDKNAVKRLQKSGLDKLRITWATGYEDYDIQEVEYFQRTLRCLE